MSIEFSRTEKERIVAKVKTYFLAEMDQEIGAFEAEFLVDFFSEEIGPFFYNRGLYDAQSLISGKVEELADAILAIEKPIDPS